MSWVPMVRSLAGWGVAHVALETPPAPAVSVAMQLHPLDASENVIVPVGLSVALVPAVTVAL